jgi:hypothetical protein
MHQINEVTRRATEKPAKVLPLGRERQRWYYLSWSLQW